MIQPSPSRTARVLHVATSEPPFGLGVAEAQPVLPAQCAFQHLIL